MQPDTGIHRLLNLKTNEAMASSKDDLNILYLETSAW